MRYLLVLEIKKQNNSNLDSIPIQYPIFDSILHLFDEYLIGNQKNEFKNYNYSYP